MIACVPEAALGAVRALAPAGVEVRPLEPEDTAIDRLDGVAFLVCESHHETVLDRLGDLPALQVVQTLSAGVDWALDRVPPDVTLCSARGTRDVPVAEWVLGMLLGVGHGLFDARLAQAERRWAPYEQAELAGSTVLVLGPGSIGDALRRRLEALDAEVLAVGRERRPGVHAGDELPDLLPRADAVVVLTPLTDETRGMVDAAFLARMRDGALLVNAGRGAVARTDDLLAEASTGRLRFALDVVDPEPLPAEHPLWSAPGVVLTPHVAGNSPPADARAHRLAGEQLRRLASGEPLVNVVAR